MRHKTVLKVEDEDFIFIRRAHNIKSQNKMHRKDQSKAIRESNLSEGDNHLAAQMDSEESKETYKRQKIVF
jgi:hypothetical protein